jgi:hypothetical protein
VKPSNPNLLGRLALFVILASGLGCSAAPAKPTTPVSFSFHPTCAGAELWLATPVAVELTNETDARSVEAVDAMYVGELVVRGARVRPAEVALIAAEAGATHFRVLQAGDEERFDVVLYRVETKRWPYLPATLRPAQVAGTAFADPARASL